VEEAGISSELDGVMDELSRIASKRSEISARLFSVADLEAVAREFNQELARLDDERKVLEAALLRAEVRRDQVATSVAQLRSINWTDYWHRFIDGAVENDWRTVNRMLAETGISVEVDFTAPNARRRIKVFHDLGPIA